MLEYESLQMGTVGSMKGNTKEKANAPKMTVVDLVNTLEEIAGTLEHAHVDHRLVVQVLKQVSFSCMCVCVCVCVIVCDCVYMCCLHVYVSICDAEITYSLVLHIPPPSFSTASMGTCSTQLFLGKRYVIGNMAVRSGLLHVLACLQHQWLILLYS